MKTFILNFTEAYQPTPKNVILVQLVLPGFFLDKDSPFTEGISVTSYDDDCAIVAGIDDMCSKINDTHPHTLSY